MGCFQTKAELEIYNAISNTNFLTTQEEELELARFVTKHLFVLGLLNRKGSARPSSTTKKVRK